MSDEGFSFNTIPNFSIRCFDYSGVGTGNVVNVSHIWDPYILATAPQSGNSAFSYQTPDASNGESEQLDGEDDLEEASCSYDESSCDDVKSCRSEASSSDSSHEAEQVISESTSGVVTGIKIIIPA